MSSLRAIFLVWITVSGVLLATPEWPLPPTKTGLLYLSGFGSNNIGEYDRYGNLLRTITVPGLSSPRGVAVDAVGNLVVVCQSPARILRIGLDGALLQTITHPDLTSGTGISQAPDGSWYVGNFSPGRVVVFDSSWSYVTTVTAAGMNGVNCVSFDANGDFAISAALVNQVYRFNSSHNPIGTVSNPYITSPMSIASDSQGNHYLSNGGSDIVIKFDATWNPLMVFGSGVLAAPQGIAVDENDLLTISNFSSSSVYRYTTSGSLVGSWPIVSQQTVRNLAFQTSPLVLSRRGEVNAVNGEPEPVLGIVGASPDAWGRIPLGANQAFTLDVQASTAGPAIAPFLLYVVPGEPGAAEVEQLPLGLGTFSFPTPLSGAQPVALINSLGLPAVLGTGLLPPTQAPVQLSYPAGLGIIATLTLQGFVLDLGSPAAPAITLSPTNALVLSFL